MREIDKAVNHINNAIFWIDMRVETLENKIKRISDDASQKDVPLTYVEERQLGKMRQEIKNLFVKKNDLTTSLEILHKYV